MKVTIKVLPRQGLADPESEATEATLKKLGFKKIKHCAIGRWIVLDVDATSKEQAKTEVKAMCDKLLINPIVEDATVTVED